MSRAKGEAHRFRHRDRTPPPRRRHGGSARTAALLLSGDSACPKQFPPDLSPDTSCRRVGVSCSALYRLFAEVGGVAQYIRARRLHAARAALAETGGARRVSEIAFGYGFTDAAAFSRSFRQAYGLSPSDLVAATGPVADTGEAELFSAWMRAVAP